MPRTPQPLQFFEDHVPLLQPASGDVTAEAVFAGSGITAPELGRHEMRGGLPAAPAQPFLRAIEPRETGPLTST